MTALSCLLTSAAFALDIANDMATNAPYAVGQEYIQVGTPPGNQTAATNGMNGGFGFNAWQRGGYGTPPNNGSTLITNINASFNMGAQQFGMRSAPNGSEGADARRRLLNPLGIGSVISASLMHGGNGAGQANTQGEAGVEFRSGLLANPGRDMFTVIGEVGQNWRVFRLGGSVVSPIAVTPGQRLDVSARQLGNEQFEVTLTPFGGTPWIHVGTVLSANDAPGQLIQTMQFYVFGTNGDFYVNNLRAVPEPATLAILGLAGVAALRRRRAR